MAAPEATPVRRDPVIEVYKPDIDRSLLRENLRLTPEERLRKLQDFVRVLHTIREAGRAATT